MKDAALSYLGKNYLKHAGIIECVRHDDIDYLYVGGDGVFIYDRSAKIYMMATDSPAVSFEALKRCEGASLIVCHNDFEYEQIRDKFGLYGLNKCHQVVWTSGKKLPLSGVCEVKRLELTEENIDFVFEHYTLAFDREHIAYIMKNMGMYGGYIDGKLVGFIGRHEERSMGLLEVLPAYRRMGIGTEIESYLINDLLENGEVPYAHIIYGNEKSVAMHVKFGFAFSETPVFWLFKK